MNWPKLKKRWVHHRNLLARGHSEISLFYGVVQMSLIIWLFLRDITTFSRFWLFAVVPIIIILATAIQYLVGWFMERHKLIDDLQKWDTERNPLITKIIEILDKK